MNTDNFFSINIVDKFSRMFMLIFAGILLGAVLGLAYYNIFSREIGSTLVVISAYCVLFICYVALTNLKRQSVRIEIFKDALCFVTARKNEISKKYHIKYSDIKTYKISAQCEKKKEGTACIDDYSLRIFGYKTLIELKEGGTLEFSDSSLDGVLIYSPSYAYRMLDIKAYVPDFPLVLENFSSKRDAEDFESMFKYYENKGEVLPFYKNKRYLLCLLKYTLTFVFIAVSVASIIAYAAYLGLNSVSNTGMLYAIALKILSAIVIPIWIIAFCTSIFGGEFNRHSREVIKEIIQE